MLWPVWAWSFLVVCGTRFGLLAMEVGDKRVWQNVSGGSLNLVLERSGHYVVFSCHQGLEAFPRNFSGVIFIVHPNLRIIQSSAFEEVRFRCAGHQHRDAHVFAL